VRKPTRPGLIAVTAAFALALSGNARAHAFLDHAQPRVGSVIAKAPTEARLTFTQAVVVPLSRVEISGPPGFGGAGPPRTATGDARTLVVELNGAAPAGVYVVRWRVVSVDTHVTEGDFSFTVRR
jgi:methionine-rich copper-binding protein CopC